ncbi:MAG: zinc-ribbon domain containing protein [Chloroflexaceae bacterium]|jgi:CxxC-x17-CxxC domain-containing protein|nr:zinc-ribbon domain containing protein [Chloroflexaceae bacterium]
MTFVDKTLTCRDCGLDFVFTAGEQEFFATKGFTNEPTRCQGCRQARKGAMGARQGGAGRNGAGAARGVGERVSYVTTCAQCGQETTVPFVPRGHRPVYCTECFQQQRSH